MTCGTTTPVTPGCAGWWIGLGWATPILVNRQGGRKAWSGQLVKLSFFLNCDFSILFIRGWMKVPCIATGELVVNWC